MTSGIGMAEARSHVDRRFALLLGAEPALLRTPGTHYVETRDFDSRAWMRFALRFLAVAPAGNPAATVIAAAPEVCAAARMQLQQLDSPSPAAAESALFDIASSLGADDSYVCDLLVGVSEHLRLSDDAGEVTELPAGSAEAIDWDGMVVSSDVDGPIFTTADERGLTSWAGIKRVSPWAQDFQVATRPDVRGRGLARTVSSAAIRRLVDEGITPYYAHASDNVASAALARTLGFEPYGRAVFAESRLPA